MADAEKAFGVATTQFNDANDAYIKAANALSQAELDYQNALGEYKDA